MGNILKILSKYLTLIVFFILEIIAIVFIVQNNKYHRVAYINKANQITGDVNTKRNDFISYLYLRSYNDTLAMTNATALKDLFNAKNTISKLNLEADTNNNSSLHIDSKYEIIPAVILKNSITQKRNYIFINKGKLEGVEKGMGVISENGPIGMVVNVTDHYAVVMSVLHSESAVSAQINHTKYFGNIAWNQGDIRIATLEEIPKHVKIKVGDTLLTSPYSSSYPEGILIGKVLKYNNEASSNHAEAKVLLFNDFSNLHHVYVIKNNEKKEIEKLEAMEEDLNKDKTN
jgi:rod shape-determining protein MreC